MKPLPERLCLFRYVHRLTQFPISEYQSDCHERQAFPGLSGLWTAPLNFVMHYRYGHCVFVSGLELVVLI